jgi:ribonuclease HII
MANMGTRVNPINRFPDFSVEEKLYSSGFKYICGVDEAGRGSLAGPIVAAAAILPIEGFLDGVRDSKLLSPKKREQLYYKIRKISIAFSISKVSSKKIDRINIGKANNLVFEKAVLKLKVLPDCVLIDGRKRKLNLVSRQVFIPRGDILCYSIACASILAKVYRDKLMIKYHDEYPHYGFFKHKGYGTEHHVKMLKKHGPSPIHRRTFDPVKSWAKAYGQRLTAKFGP